jgi:hypothetical protein
LLLQHLIIPREWIMRLTDLALMMSHIDGFKATMATVTTAMVKSELSAMIQIRSRSSSDCADCAGIGWV